MLLLSLFDDTIRRPTAAIAAQRNAYVAALADRLLIAHAERGGKTEALCKDTLAQGKPVFAWTPRTMRTLWNLVPRRLRLKIPCLSR